MSDRAAFQELSLTSGILRMDLMGEEKRIPYTSRNHLDPAGTIGWAEVEVDGKINHMFLSRTAAGVVLTMVGQEAGPLDFPIAGYHKIVCATDDADFDTVLALHRQALAGEAVLTDPDWLRAEIPGTAQRAADVMAVILPRLMGMMDDLFEDMGKAMGQMMEGVGQAMGKVMEGVGQAMGEVAKGLDDALGGSDLGTTADATPADPTAEPKPETKAKVKAKAKVKPATKAKPKPKSKPKAKVAKAKAKTKVAKAKPKAKAKAKTKTKTKTRSR
jgi:hypothetical protein